MKRDLIKRNRQLLSAERGTVFKDPGGKLNLCLVYPNTYYIGMSNLGYTGLYSLLNGRDDVVCERAFLPEKEYLNEFERTGTELFSMESERPLHKFDVIGFSVSFENDYPNILQILSLSNIKCLNSERGSHDPILMMGGPCAFMNPEPLSDFMDLVFVGEAEEMLDDFITIVKKQKAKQEILRVLSRIEGFYIPSFYEPRYSQDNSIVEIKRKYADIPRTIRRRYVEDINTNILSSCLLTSKTEFKDMFLIEVMRGCPFSCRFCAAGHIYNPPRQRRLAVIQKEVERTQTVNPRVGLIAPSLTEYRSIKELLRLKDVSLSITSLRASKKSADIVTLIRDKRSVSIAPEAGSQRLRDVVKKQITDEDVLSAAELIFETNISTLKLYFMVGLPTETDEDIDAIVVLTRRIRSLSKKGRISLTLSPFVPKPFTPFQWHPMTAIDTVKRRIRRIKKGTAIKSVRILHDAVKDVYMQGLFAVGNRQVGRIIPELIRKRNIRDVSRKAGVDFSSFIFRKKEFEEILPWDFIDNGVSKERLWSEYMYAIKGFEK